MNYIEEQYYNTVLFFRQTKNLSSASLNIRNVLGRRFTFQGQVYSIEVIKSRDGSGILHKCNVRFSYEKSVVFQVLMMVNIGQQPLMTHKNYVFVDILPCYDGAQKCIKGIMDEKSHCRQVESWEFDEIEKHIKAMIDQYSISLQKVYEHSPFIIHLNLIYQGESLTNQIENGVQFQSLKNNVPPIELADLVGFVKQVTQESQQLKIIVVDHQLINQIQIDVVQSEQKNHKDLKVGSKISLKKLTVELGQSKPQLYYRVFLNRIAQDQFIQYTEKQLDSMILEAQTKRGLDFVENISPYTIDRHTYKLRIDIINLVRFQVYYECQNCREGRVSYQKKLFCQRCEQTSQNPQLGGFLIAQAQDLSGPCIIKASDKLAFKLLKLTGEDINLIIKYLRTSYESLDLAHYGELDLGLKTKFISAMIMCRPYCDYQHTGEKRREFNNEYNVKRSANKMVEEINIQSHWLSRDCPSDLRLNMNGSFMINRQTKKVHQIINHRWREYLVLK